MPAPLVVIGDLELAVDQLGEEVDADRANQRRGVGVVDECDRVARSPGRERRRPWSPSPPRWSPGPSCRCPYVPCPSDLRALFLGGDVDDVGETPRRAPSGSRPYLVEQVVGRHAGGAPAVRPAGRSSTSARSPRNTSSAKSMSNPWARHRSATGLHPLAGLVVVEVLVLRNALGGRAGCPVRSARRSRPTAGPAPRAAGSRTGPRRSRRWAAVVSKPAPASAAGQSSTQVDRDRAQSCGRLGAEFGQRRRS